MSIWASVSVTGDGGELTELPTRDNYTGQPAQAPKERMLANPNYQKPHPGYVDVATARGWHDLIRLSVGGGQDPTDAEVLITVGQARTLCALLEAAVAVIETNPAGAQENQP